MGYHYTAEEMKQHTGPDGTIDWGALAMKKIKAEFAAPRGEKSAKKTIDINELPIFKIADKLCDKVWDMVAKWDFFSKKTLGDQITRSADSVAANITEGYGRYFFREYITFLYYARGSLYETRFWLEKARNRELVDEKLYNELKREYDKLPMEINKVIKIVKSEEQKWKAKPRY